MTVVLELKPETLRRIEEQATQKGMTPEQLLVELAEAKFDDEKSVDFRTAADYVLNKNAELLERLAQGKKEDALADYLLNKNAELYRRLA